MKYMLSIISLTILLIKDVLSQDPPIDLQLNEPTKGRGYHNSVFYKLQIPEDINLKNKDLIFKLRSIYNINNGVFSDPDLFISKVSPLFIIYFNIFK